MFLYKNQIGSLNEGELFCCGEDLKSTYVLACSKVRCLVISGYILDTFDRMGMLVINSN